MMPCRVLRLLMTVVCLASGYTAANAAWATRSMQQVGVSLRSSNAKVQWNACYAAGQALRSNQLRSYPEAAVQLALMLCGLLDVLTSSANYKARTQAAAALEGLSGESVTAEQREEALVALAAAIDAVGRRKTGFSSQDAAAEARTAGSQALLADADAHPSTAADRGFVQPADGVVPLSELRYRAGLLTQLQSSLEHLQRLDTS